jgi:hypothetical protein
MQEMAAVEIVKAVSSPYMGTSMSRTENVQQPPLSLAVSGPV